MEMFLTTASQMLFLFTCIIIGYLLKKMNVLPDNTATILSKLESLVFIPALLLNSFSANCTFDNLVHNADLIVYGLIFVAIQCGIALLTVKFFTKDPTEKGIFLYSLTVVNFSFMGNSLISGLFGSEMLFKYLIFVIPLNVFTFSVGYIWLTAGREKFSLKLLLNPIMIYMLIGMVLGLTQIPLPAFVRNTMSSFAACFSPIAMILTGFVIGGFELKKLLTNTKIYLLTAWRCVILPIIILLLVKVIGIPDEVRLLLIFITAMPLGLNTIVFPASYGGNTTPGASMAVISNVLGLITVPLFLMYFL